MEGSSGSTGRAVPSQPLWNSLSPRRNRIPLSFSDPGATSSSPEAPVSPRSIGSRRRKMWNRLSRPSPDQRNVVSPTLNAEAPEFVPEPAARAPSKRKASSSATPGKTSHTASGMTSATTANVELPIIQAEEVFPTASSPPSTPHSLALREILDSSDDELDTFDPATYQTAAIYPAEARTPNHHPHRTRNDLLASRIYRSPRTTEEPKWRQEPSPKLAAVLVCNDNTSRDYDVSRMRYLPLCPARKASRYLEDNNNDLLTILPSHRDFAHRSRLSQDLSKTIWPPDELPVELFDLITSHLARDDVMSMRLVNREFERKVSRSLFHTSVVPFNTEIYDMIDEDRKTMSRAPRPVTKGKGKMKARPDMIEDPSLSSDAVGLHWQNATEDKDGKVYKGHGLRVFQGFGPHMKRFGMSFDISEKQLSNPPSKKKLDHIESYHGSYEWPSEHYARFASLAGLESTADETSRMKAAFANLRIVQELALSVDSGLGWLNGPDKSVRSHLFERPSSVFGTSYKVPDHATQAASKFWADLQQSQRCFDPHSSLREISLEHRTLSSTPAQLEGLRDTIYSDTQLWSSIDHDKVTSALASGPSKVDNFGVLYITTNQTGGRSPLHPVNLNRDQQEWLLETQWAQQAFLESYMLAVIDNPNIFHNVTKLNIAKLSSCFLPMLTRESFWEALPHLSDATLHVSADWRTVEKNDIGLAHTTNKYPSQAVDVFHKDVLQHRVAMRRSIKTLNIGWVGGGEHAEGMFARNGHILPAPITPLDHCTANSNAFSLVFKHVEHLILSNCWISPPVLEGLVQSHSHMALKKLTLDSVSLTAHPKFPVNHQAAAGVHAQAPPNLAHAFAAVQAQFANNAQAVAQGLAAGLQQQGAPPGLPAQPWVFMPPLNAQQMVAAQQQALLPPHLFQHMQQVQNQMQLNGNGPVGQLALNPQPQPQAHQHAQVQLAPPQPPQLPNATGGNAGNAASSHWTAGHREGSWPHLLDAISPGVVFDDYLPAPPPWEEPLPLRPATNLRAIELKSCGYVKLPGHCPFDQMVLEPTADIGRHDMSSWFRVRWSTIKSHMMHTADRHLGQIVQYMPQRELNALQFAWGLTEGWEDHWKAEGAEFDGIQPGGTGRFSGILQSGMSLIGPAVSANSSAGDAL